MKRLDPDIIFESDHLSQDLARKSVQGGMTTFSAQGIRFVLNLIRTMILARLLTPDDFGLVAMVMVVINFAQMFKEAGLSMATVQKDKITHEQISTLFWINVLLGLGIGLIVLFSSPLVSRFYGRSELTAVTAALSLLLIGSGAMIQYNALLRRHMMFGTLATVQISTQVISICLTILLALFGFRYWALVWGYVIPMIANIAMTFYLCPWRPGKMRRGTHIRGMLRFGGHLLTSRMIGFFVRNLDNVLLGVVWGANTVGLYSKAYALLMFPMQQLNRPLSAVAVPSLSRLTQNIDQFRRYFCKGLRYVTFFSIPLVVFSYVAAEEIILLMLGQQWTQCIIIFQALAPAALLSTIGFAGGWVLVPLGRTGRQLRLSFWGGLVVIFAFFIGIHWGPIGMACAFSIVSVLLFPVQTMYAFHDTPIRLRDLGQALWRPFVASLIAAALVFLFSISIVIPNVFVTFVLKSVIFMGVYLLVWTLIPGGMDQLKDLSDLRGYLSNKKAVNYKVAGNMVGS